MYPWTVGLKTHSILYKVFINKKIGEYLSFINSSVKSYCVPYSKLVWNRGTILNEDGLVASNLWSDFMSSIFDLS
jgi:hypothetical protein